MACSHRKAKSSLILCLALTRLHVISALTSPEDGSEAENGGRWRHLAEVT
jgi:hypothetical protein